MKKNVLLVAALFTAAFTATEIQAQDFKPAAGEKTVEVNFAPLGGTPISISALKFRSFMSEDMALRLGVNISYSSNASDPSYAGPDSDNDGIGDEELIDRNSSMGITLMPGIEKHFGGTDRLSPYMGGVLTIGYNRTTVRDEQFGDADLTDTDPTGSVYEDKTTDGSLDLGLNFVLGADWYFSPKIYMGTEVGFGFLYSNISDTQYEYGVTVPEPDNRPEETARGSNFNLGPNFNGAIRLGYAF